MLSEHWNLNVSTALWCVLSQAGDDAKIRVWQIPKEGLTETLTEPECVLRGKKLAHVTSDL